LIRKSEIKLVEKLFVFEFFQGASIAIFFTTAISIFLENRPTTELPKVFILASILLWLFGFLYSKLEHNFPVRTVILSVLIFNLSAIVLFRLLMQHQEETWFLFLFLSFFYVIYLLNNLEFWGLSALLFDVRQSKRLFGIVSAGDIPAKMLGYLVAFAMIPFIGTANLLWVAAAFLSIAFLVYRPLMHHANVDKFDKPSSHHHATHSVHSIKAAIKINPLIRKIALVSLFSFSCLLIVTYVFYGYVKQEFNNNKDLATFFAIFFAVVRGVTLVIKMAGTNRMVDKMGLKNALVIPPVIIFLICLPAVYFSSYVDVTNLFYMFGVLSVFIEVLRSAILTPVLLAAMQPLPTHQRLRGHTIVKGLMDPVAFIITGMLLLFIPIIQGGINFSIVSFFLLFMIIGWIYFSLSVEKDYIDTLKDAVKDRSLNPRDISFSDKDSLDFLLKRIEKGTEKEAISVLQLVAQQTEHNKIFIERALEHSSASVKMYALNIIKDKKLENLLPQLKLFLDGTTDKALLSQGISTLALVAPQEDLTEYINHSDADVSHAAAIAILTQSNFSNHEKAEETLKDLFASSKVKDKISALQIASDLKALHYNNNIITLMEDTSPTVSQAACIAAAVIGGEDLIDKLLLKYNSTRDDSAILEALAKGGDSVLPGINQYLFQNKCYGNKCRKLISYLGKKGGDASVSILEECLRKFPENSNAILLSLHQANIKSKKSEEQYAFTIRENLIAASHILFKLDFSSRHHANKIVFRALELELAGIKNKCLWLFSFLYDSDKIKRARIGFDLNTKESVANALELIQVTVPKEFSIPFSIIYENGTIEDKCMQLRKTVHEPLITESSLIKNILFDVDYIFNSWTKACVLYSLSEGKKNVVKMDFIIPFKNSENKVLKNTADFLVEKYALN
jgi:ATP:ADP antiporter, AAA family